MTLSLSECQDILGIAIDSTTKYPILANLLPLITVQINDYAHGAFAHQVKEEPITFGGAGSSNPAALTHTFVIRDSVYVSSTDRSRDYYGDCMFTQRADPRYSIPSTEIEEYRVDYATGEIWATSTEGNLIPTTNALVTYSYVDLVDGGKAAAVRLLDQLINQPGGVNAESGGGLSRSYSAGFDPMVERLLAPYRRPAFR